jgi:hypothetical protein
VGGADNPVTVSGADNPITVCGEDKPIIVCDAENSITFRFKYKADPAKHALRDTCHARPQ